MNTLPLFRSCRALFLTAIFVFAAHGQAQAAGAPKSIAAALQPFVDNHTLAGAVTLVTSPEKVLCLQSVGYADLAARKPMRSDCLFWIASQSKPIAATALMMLVDQGRVSLADPVEKYLPEFKGQQVRCGPAADRPLQACRPSEIRS